MREPGFSGCDQSFGHGAGKEISSLDVEVRDGVVVCLCGVCRRGVAGETSGVDEDIEGAVGGDGGLGRGNVGDVEREGGGLPALRLERGRLFLNRRGGAGNQRDVGASLGQGYGAAFTDAGGRASDQRAFAVKAHGRRARKAHENWLSGKEMGPRLRALLNSPIRASTSTPNCR